MILDPSFIGRVGLALLVSAVLAFLITPLVKRLAERVGAMDVPTDSRRMHHRPIHAWAAWQFLSPFLSVC